jgi:hypothetical protein
MARAAQSAANRLNELESTRPRTPRGKPAMRQSLFAASARGARPHRARNRLGADPAKIANWESRPDLSNEISERDGGGKPI